MMATTFGHERIPGASPMRPVDDADLLSVPMDDGVPRNDVHSDQLSADGPPPNPPFHFPAAPLTPSSAPSSFSRATGRRTQSTIEPQSMPIGIPAGAGSRQARPTALPAFSFNPGASLPRDPLQQTLLSPPLSPLNAITPSPNRPSGHGHRRGGSEFVGGRLRDGNSIAVMSSSPTKSESGLASPSFPPVRRGHRRGVSGAISTNDLPLLPPPVNSFDFKGNSAPTSPTDFNHPEYMTIPQKDEPAPSTSAAEQNVSQMATAPAQEVAPKPDDDAQPVVPVSPRQARPNARARVGFSDTLEFIPRPLSLVSSDTSSTMTARPSHSVSGSISSLVSASSPNGKESPQPLPRSSLKDMTDSRPSTAGAILERTTEISKAGEPNVSPRRRNSIPALIEVANATAVTPPTPSPTKAPKRWTFFGLESLTSSGSPIKGRPHSSSSSDSTPGATSLGSSSDHGSESIGEPTDGGSSKPKKNAKKSKKKKKKKRVKGWAGSILTRKPKGSGKPSKLSMRPPTPPASVPPEDDDEEMEDIQSVPSQVSTPTVTVTESPAPTDNNRRRPVEESPVAMIDLDAALGPFNTPLPHNAEWEAAQRAAGSAGKRRLHSAQGLRGFTGPGMHYHRRAESAPDLPPFDPGRNNIHRFGSNSTMADVFEEDEEDDEDGEVSDQSAFQAGSESAEQPSEPMDDSEDEATPPAAPANDNIDTVPEIPSQIVRRRSSGLSDSQSIRAERSRTSLQDNVIAEEPPSIIFRTTNVFQGRPDSSGSAANSQRVLAAPKDLSHAESGTFHPANLGAIPMSPYSASYASSHPSPRTPISVDAQRITTGPSSINDENSFQSLLMGEPGPELRISVDYDIPSLTSSNSTMTRESNLGPNPRFPGPSLREPRPASVSSAAFGRRRSSLVSLSRLISSSHGERSKLSTEVTLDSDTDTKKARGSRTKRLSRLVQFWKPSKDGSPV